MEEVKVLGAGTLWWLYLSWFNYVNLNIKSKEQARDTKCDLDYPMSNQESDFRSLKSV